jgi:predicted transcriptional regulator
MKERIASRWIEANKKKAIEIFKAMPKDQWLSIFEIARLSKFSERDVVSALKILKRDGVVWENDRMYQRVR